VRQFRRHREAVFERALGTLADDERRALAAALPAMGRLANSLEAIGTGGGR
jgi:hypothetical protein